MQSLSFRKIEPSGIGEILVPSRFPKIESGLNDSVIEVVCYSMAKMGLGNSACVPDEARPRDSF
jgi:hypothetical protein